MQPERHSPDPAPPHVTAGYALTLFVLGALLGLLALLGRLAFELHAALMGRIAALGHFSTGTPDDLAPLLRDPTAPGTALVLAGFAISTLCLLGSALLWRHTGHPVTLRERVWGRFTHGITLLLWLAMASAALAPWPGVRIALVVGFGGAALAALIAFVYLLVEFRFLASAPPLPDESPPDDDAA
jgi:hypothetical protein